MARHRRAIGLFRDATMSGRPAPFQTPRMAVPATLDTSSLAAIRHEQIRDVRLVAMVLAAGLLAGLAVLAHSLS
jgi:hypothetical protein